MTHSKLHSSSGERGEPIRQRVLDAAERLLRSGKAEFSMRDLSAEAGVSFATPFNQFSSKAGIMHALSGRRIDTMRSRLSDMALPVDATARVRLAVETAVAVMLKEPEVNRAVMGWIGTAGPSQGDALARSTAYWTLALTGQDEGGERCPPHARDALPLQLALAFRGALSFWTAGELPDKKLRPTALAIAEALMSAATSL